MPRGVYDRKKSRRRGKVATRWTTVVSDDRASQDDVNRICGMYDARQRLHQFMAVTQSPELRAGGSNLLQSQERNMREVINAFSLNQLRDLMMFALTTGLEVTPTE